MPLFVKTKKYIPVYNDSATQFYAINLNEDIWSSENHEKKTLPIEEFVKYVNLLMPLMSDIWLEVCPDEKVESYTEITILSKHI